MKKIRLFLISSLILLWTALLAFGCGEPLSNDRSDLFHEDAPVAPEEAPLLPSEEEEPPDSEEQEPSSALQEPPLPAEDGTEVEKKSEEETEGEPYQYRAPQSDLTPYLAACATANVHVRKGPSTYFDVLTTLPKGESLPFLWQEGEWLAVWEGERVGYLHSSYAFLSETNRAIERVIHAGIRKLGTPYEWGAARLLNDKGEVSPYFTGESFDCSSFVQYCYYVGAGIKLGNYTGSQADHTVGQVITNYADLRRGDFYFTGKGSVSHVVIYLGNGILLQTYSANGGPVSITQDERWKSNFLSGRRPDLTVTDQYA